MCVCPHLGTRGTGGIVLGIPNAHIHVMFVSARCFVCVIRRPLAYSTFPLCCNNPYSEGLSLPSNGLGHPLAFIDDGNYEGVLPACLVRSVQRAIHSPSRDQAA